MQRRQTTTTHRSRPRPLLAPHHPHAIPEHRASAAYRPFHGAWTRRATMQRHRRSNRNTHYCTPPTFSPVCEVQGIHAARIGTCPAFDHVTPSSDRHTSLITSGVYPRTATSFRRRPVHPPNLSAGMQFPVSHRPINGRVGTKYGHGISVRSFFHPPKIP